MNFRKLRAKTEKEQDKLYKETLERCVPIAKEITKLIGEHAETYPFGSDAQASDESHTLSTKIITLFIERGVRWTDRDFIIQLALQPIDGVKTIMAQSFDRSWNLVLTGILDKKISELTFPEVDALLKKGQDLTPEVIETTKEGNA